GGDVGRVGDGGGHRRPAGRVGLVEEVPQLHRVAVGDPAGGDVDPCLLDRRRADVVAADPQARKGPYDVGDGGRITGAELDARLRADVRGGDAGPCVGRLVDDQVGVGERRDLRQVGDDDDLVPAGEASQAAPDLAGCLTTDPGVDLVEDHHRHRIGAGEDHLD